MKNKGLIFGLDSSIFLFISIFAFIFIFPIIDNKVIHDFFITISYILVLLSIFSIIETHTKKFSYLIVIAIIANILMYFADNEFVRVFTFLISVTTFYNSYWYINKALFQLVKCNGGYYYTSY